MKCTACGYENILKANYCKKCGKSFSEEEKKSAYQKTVYWKIQQLETAKTWLDLSKITGNLYFRIAVLAVLLVLVVFNMSKNGTRLAIRNSDQYTVAYAEHLDEYYLMTDRDQVDVIFYLPRQTDQLTLSVIENQTLISLETIDPDKGITLSKWDKGYYILTADYTDETSEQILFFVCEEGGK